MPPERALHCGHTSSEHRPGCAAYGVPRTQAIESQPQDDLCFQCDRAFGRRPSCFNNRSRAERVRKKCGVIEEDCPSRPLLFAPTRCARETGKEALLSTRTAVPVEVACKQHQPCHTPCPCQLACVECRRQDIDVACSLGAFFFSRKVRRTFPFKHRPDSQHGHAWLACGFASCHAQDHNFFKLVDIFSASVSPSVSLCSVERAVECLLFVSRWGSANSVS